MESSFVRHCACQGFPRFQSGNPIRVAAMTDSRLHVVFGAGQVGRALVATLAGQGRAVRAVSRHRPLGLPEGVDSRVVDVSDS